MATNSNNPPSFRVAFESQIAKLPPEIQRVHRTTLNAITDLQEAIPELKTQIDTVSTSITKSTSSSSAATTGPTATATNASVASAIAAAVSGVVSSFKALLPGGVNNQTGVTAYQTVQTDYGALVLFNDASPVALTLAVTASLPVITLPWYCCVLNEGTGSVTVTPAAGQINGGSSITVAIGEMAFIFYDGTNFWAGIAAAAGSGVTQITAGTGIAISPPGGTGNVTVSIANTAVTPGSYTNTNLTVNAEGQITAAANGTAGTPYLKGTVVVACGGATSGTFSGSGTVTGARPTMTAAASWPGMHDYVLAGNQLTWECAIPSNDTVEVLFTFPNIGISQTNVTFYVTVFP